MDKKHTSIYSALAADVLIAVIKFISGAYTNSSSMIAEGIHSLVDSSNGLLLLYGLKRSKKPPDKERPFGYGRELYFWSFIVSILIFGIGGGLSIFEGVSHIVQHRLLEKPFWNYMVLAFSFLFDGTSFVIAIRAFNKIRGDLSFWRAIIRSKDPSSFIVLLEDGAAVVGLVIVFLLMVCGQFFNLPFLDGLASILVGLLLVFTSLLLARESRSLLMGEGIRPETQERIKTLAEKDPAVNKVKRMLSSYESPEDILLMMTIDFKENLETEEITDAIERIRKNIKDEFKLIEYVIIQPV